MFTFFFFLPSSLPATPPLQHFTPPHPIPPRRQSRQTALINSGTKPYSEGVWRASRCDQLSSGRFSLISGFKYWVEAGREAEKQHVNQPHYTAVIHLPGAVIHAVFTPYICFCGNISSRGMAWWQDPDPPHPTLAAPPSSILSSTLHFLSFTLPPTHCWRGCHTGLPFVVESLER